ncbi:unnamed protein product, partial [Laminaria digitata]
NVTTLIEVALEDGQSLSGRADHARGSTRLPMGFDDVAGKFRGCATYCGHAEERIADIETMVRRLDTLETADSLIDALVSN